MRTENTLCDVKHSHDELKFVESKGAYICLGCMEPGIGSRYTCEKCSFKLHKCCMRPQRSCHEFFPNATFEFFQTPPNTNNNNNNNCEACTMSIGGYSYHCQNQNLNLHPVCMELTAYYKLRSDDGHGHRADVALNLHDKVRGECFLCHQTKSINIGSHRDNKNGWSYVSDCGSFHFHVACLSHKLWLQAAAQDKLSDSIFDPFLESIFDPFLEKLKIMWNRISTYNYSTLFWPS